MSLSPSATEEYRQAAIVEALRQCRLFADLDDGAIRKVAYTCVLKSYQKGDYLFREGERAAGFYVIKSGSVNVHRVTPDGKEQVLCVFRAPESFAEVTLTTIDTYPADAVALEPSQILLIQKREFRSLIESQPDLVLRMLTSMSFHLKYLVQLIEDLKFKQIEARLSHWLTRQRPPSQPSGRFEVRLDTSKRVLASQLGVTSETLSRTLAKFRDEGLITVEGPRITILDSDGLLAYLG